MPLTQRTMPSRALRAPEVPRGEAIIVDRYNKDPKVALINPVDLAMLEESHDILAVTCRLELLEVDELTLKTLKHEDTPDPAGPLEDPVQIAAILGL